MELRTIARTLASLSALSVLAGGIAFANTFTGTVYSTAAYPASLSPSQTPTGTPFGSFTTDQIDFLDNSPSYTVGSFLSSNGSVSTLSPGLAGMSMDNKEFKITGSQYFAAGMYTLTHDDGVYLYLNGSSQCTVCSGSPTEADTSTFSITTAGTYSFDLLYAEVNGAPAVLEFPATVTPEPSSFLLLGSGLMSAAGLVRRRIAASR